MTAIDETERLKRWRLVLGQDAQQAMGLQLGGQDAGMDAALEALYGSAGNGGGGGGRAGSGQRRSAGLGASSPNVARWLGDIRSYFPSSAVKGKLANPLLQAVRGSLNRATRTNRPRGNEIDWDRTIRANLKNYLPDRGTIIAEKLVGYGHKRSSLRDIVLCVDQSGSMATSVVYAGIFGAVLATLRAVSTRMVVFDTAVVDLTDDLHDPVDLLFGTQLGGGTDINRALTYCQQVITRPAQTILVLITDLYEGGNQREMLRRAAELAGSGVQLVCLLALSDDGSPSFDQHNAAALAAMGAPRLAALLAALARLSLARRGAARSRAQLSTNQTLHQAYTLRSHHHPRWRGSNRMSTATPTASTTR